MLRGGSLQYLKINPFRVYFKVLFNDPLCIYKDNVYINKEIPAIPAMYI